MSLFCLFVVLYSVMSATNIITKINFIPMINDFNFKSGQENLLIILAVMDLDLVLRVDFSPPLTDESNPNDKREIKWWERSNRMCIVIMKKVISKEFRGSMFEKTIIAKKFLA